MADNIDIVVQEIGKNISVLVTYGDPATAATIQAALGYVPADDADLAGKQDALGYTPEDIANKQTDLTSADADHYPNVVAVNTGLEKAQKEIAGVVTFDFTGEAGTTHTVTILPDHSGKTIHIRANLDDEVTIVVGNDIEINQPITIRKTGEFSLELRGANTDIIIEANGVEDDAGVDYVDISGDLIDTVQIMKEANNVIWGIGI